MYAAFLRWVCLLAVGGRGLEEHVERMSLSLCMLFSWKGIVLPWRVVECSVISMLLPSARLKEIIANFARSPDYPNTQHHGKEGDEGSSRSPQEGNEGDEGKESMKVSWVLDCFNSRQPVFAHALAFSWLVHEIPETLWQGLESKCRVCRCHAQRGPQIWAMWLIMRSTRLDTLK